MVYICDSGCFGEKPTALKSDKSEFFTPYSYLQLRYFIHIAYNGNNYRGWQRLPGIASVQQVMELALSKILKLEIAIIGCGRTDSQVHASQFFFHFDTELTWDFDLVFRLNKRLPHDISVFDVIKMEGLPHARFDAIQ